MFFYSILVSSVLVFFRRNCQAISKLIILGLVLPFVEKVGKLDLKIQMLKMLRHLTELLLHKLEVKIQDIVLQTILWFFVQSRFSQNRLSYPEKVAFIRLDLCSLKLLWSMSYAKMESYLRFYLKLMPDNCNVYILSI